MLLIASKQSLIPFSPDFFAVLAIEWSTIHDTRTTLNNGTHAEPKPDKDPQHKSLIDWISEPCEVLRTSQYSEREN
jgi:hypothetical protein